MWVCVRVPVCARLSDKAKARTLEIFTEMKRGHFWDLVPENSPMGLLFDLADFMVRYNPITLLHHSALSQLYKAYISNFLIISLLVLFFPHSLSICGISFYGNIIQSPKTFTWGRLDSKFTLWGISVWVNSACTLQWTVDLSRMYFCLLPDNCLDKLQHAPDRNRNKWQNIIEVNIFSSLMASQKTLNFSVEMT